MKTTPRNEIELLDISFEELSKKYQPLISNFARSFKSVNDEEDYQQEASIVLWQAHRSWVDYQTKNNARETGQTKGSFTSFVQQKLEWKRQDIFRQQRAPFLPLLEGDALLADPKQEQILEDAEVYASLSPNARSYINSRLNRSAHGMARGRKNAAIEELNAWRKAS